MKINMTKERKYLVIFGVVLLTLGAWYRFKPDGSFISESEDISIKRQQIVKYKQVISEKKIIEEKLSDLKNKVSASEPLFFDASSASLAAVEIQSTINAAAASIGINIKSTDVLREAELSKDSMYLGIPVRLTAEMDVKQLRDMIIKLEADPKYLTIKELACTVTGSKMNSVSVVLTVEGYMGKKAG